MRRLHRDERGQSLAIVLALITVLFLMGTALAAHISVALKTTVSNEAQAGDMHAADAGAELGMWWQRNGNAGNPPAITVNGLTVNATVGVAGGTPCATPSAVKVTGFEHGAVSRDGGGIFSALTGAGLSADAAVRRTGAYSLKVTDPAGSANYGSLAITPAVSTAVLRVYLRLAALPAADVSDLLTLEATAGNDLRLGYESSTRNLVLRVGNGVPAGSTAIASTTVVAGTWHRIDMSFTANTNPRTASWQVDDVTQAGVSRTGTGSTVRSLWLGSNTSADAFTANYDDVLISSAIGDYPLGDGTVVGLRPDGMGTHNTPGSFSNNDASAINATTYQRLDESPMTSLADYVRQQVGGANVYIEMTFADTNSPCVVGVSDLVAYHAAGTQNNDGGTRIVDGAAQSIVFDGNMSETTPVFYRSAIIAPASTPWTAAAVNGLTGRIGYSTDANPIPYWDGLLLEVATGIYVPGTVTVTSTAGSSTVSTTYTDVGSAMPTLLTWTTNR